MPQKRTIQTLVIDDDPFCVAVMTDFGQKMQDIELSVRHVVSLQESLNFLDSHPEIGLIILDYRVHSKITGLDILQHIRAKGIDIPIIIVTGSGDEQVAVSMMKAGASDYLVKGAVNPAVLERSVKDALEHYESRRGGLGSQGEGILKDIAIKRSLNGVCVSDLKGLISYVNPSLMSMWGLDSEPEIVGRNIKDILSQPQKFDEISEALKDKKSWMGELVGLRKDGAAIYLQALFSLIEYGQQGPGQIMSSFIDITKIKDDETKREALYKGIMEVFALRAEEVGNVETAGHIHRIATYTRFIAEKLREMEPFKGYIDDKYITDVSYASMLHDVGKWRTPNEILLKPAQLTEKEWEVMKQHPKLGVEMLMPLLKEKGTNQYLKLVESIVLYHHERWDGTGYPAGLKGEEIPLSARIVCLADNYDALVSDRSYRKALTHEEATDVIRREKEKFDPRIFQLFLDFHAEFKRIKESSTNIY